MEGIKIKIFLSEVLSEADTTRATYKAWLKVTGVRIKLMQRRRVKGITVRTIAYK